MLLYAGALVERPPGPKYVAKLPFCELSFPGALPKPATLHRFGASLPEGFLTSLVVPQSCLRSASGTLRVDEELEARFAWLLEAADALSARFLVISTAADLTPGQRDRDRLSELFARIPRPGRRMLVWDPKGLWEREEIERVAEREGVLAAFDPLEDETPDGDIVYARLRTVGARNRITSGMLTETLARLIDAAPDEAYVAIQSERSFKEAVTLAAIAAGQDDGELLE